MSKLDESFAQAMKAAKKFSDKNQLPSVVHGLPSDGEYVGTCQVCFGQYVVKQFRSGESKAGGHDVLKPMPRGKLVVVLHGYERPGYGYTAGECPGRGHEPFEVAKDVTELFRKRTAEYLATSRERLADFKNGRIKRLYIEIEDRSQPPRAFTYPKKHIMVEEGWRNEYDPFDDFKRRLKHETKKSEIQVAGLEDDLNFLDRMLADWKYDPHALTQTRGKRIGVRAADQAVAEAKSLQISIKRNTARDEKEEKARAVLDAYLNHVEAMAYAKSHQKEIFEPGKGFKMSDENIYDLVLRKYIRPAEKETNQVRRIELLKYAYGAFRDMASRAKIKVKVPRG